jgi:cysteine desulfurase
VTGPAAGRGDLDSASSAPLHPAARDVLLAALDRGYADPRRLHRGGREARLLLDNAREATADALGVRADEVTFTPSGTHAVHLGLLGLVRGSRRGDVVVHPAVEHSAVRHADAWGAQAVEVGVEPDGRVRSAELAEAASAAAVVALQTANHEVGTLQDVGAVVLPDDVPLFSDACASMGRLPLPDGWAAAAASLQAVVAERDEVNARQHELVDVVRRRVAVEVPDVEVVGDPERRLPHLVTFSCLYVDGEALVTELDRRGFGIASGSACTASTLTPSHVLEAMGVLTHGNVRLSLQRDTTRADVDAFCDALPGVVAEIRSRVGL